MRLLVVLGLALLASSARSATVDFRLELEPGTTNWSLTLRSVATGISEIALEASPSLGSFEPDPSLPLPDIIILYEPLPNGRNLLTLRADAGALLVTGPTVADVPIGIFAGTTALPSLVELLGADDSVGYTVLEPASVPLDYSITIVPEPAPAALLVGLGAVLLGARLRSRPEHAAARAVQVV